MSVMCCQSTNITAEKRESRPSVKDPRAFALLVKVEAFQIWRRWSRRIARTPCCGEPQQPPLGLGLEG
jgi:hypothetical protein